METINQLIAEVSAGAKAGASLNPRLVAVAIARRQALAMSPYPHSAVDALTLLACDLARIVADEYGEAKAEAFFSVAVENLPEGRK